MPLPSAVMRSQARFRSQSRRSGRPLTLAFLGPCVRDAATGAVSRAALGAASSWGFLSLAGLPSSLQQEIEEKWGTSFLPDGLLEWGMDALPPPGAGWGNLITVTDNRPEGLAYDVIYLAPAAFAEERCRVALVRRLPVYNRVVSVREVDEIDGADDVVLSGLPCRLRPQRSGLAQADGLGGVQSGAWTLECPPVTSGPGASPPGVVPFAAGASVLLDPKRAVVIDDPAAYGGAGAITRYRVSGLPLDKAGDGHHTEYPLVLA